MVEMRGLHWAEQSVGWKVVHLVQRKAAKMAGLTGERKVGKKG